MPYISFIVPVYNMERLLPRALRSLRAQTLTDFEAILINDGSKDGSAALCAQAVAEDARFRFIDQPNGGVAAARNAGLDAARGEYIFFLDPDDWVEPDAAEVLYHAARNADADCVEFGLYLDSYDENDRLLHTQTSVSTLSGVYRGAPFKEHFDETASSYLVTNKLFRRAFLLPSAGGGRAVLCSLLSSKSRLSGGAGKAAVPLHRCPAGQPVQQLPPGASGG